MTTEKDWVKILPLIKQRAEWQNLPLNVIRVSFEFLTSSEYDGFVRELRSL